jgi:hypothetical protein
MVGIDEITIRPGEERGAVLLEYLNCTRSGARIVHGQVQGTLLNEPIIIKFRGGNEGDILVNGATIPIHRVRSTPYAGCE